MNFYVACYDIAEDDQRLRVANVLGEFGDRVQESVFELVLRDAREIEMIVERLKEISGEPLDVRFYAVCEACRPAAFALDGAATAHRPSAIVI